LQQTSCNKPWAHSLHHHSHLWAREEDEYTDVSIVEMSVQEYLDKYMLSRKLEDAVNAAVRAKTSDPVLFIVISLSITLYRESSRFDFVFWIWIFNWILQSNHMKKGVQSVITKVKARQILDSRGIPTVEVDLYTNKAMFRASVPSGNSTGM